MNYTEINKCRVSGSTNLINVFSLGNQCLTGIFPDCKDKQVSSGPVDLLWCPDSGLVQLKQSFPSNEMYGHNYGYRSGLNDSMVNHLTTKIQYLEEKVSLNEFDVVLDIGSNDATSLKAYKTNCIKIGIDPTGLKFNKYYTNNILLVPDFFSIENFNKVSHKKAKIITSIAMFYDLEDPVKFAKDVFDALHEDGIWHFEQSYLLSMLRTNSYDTICHEHIEYYSLSVVKNILNNVGFKIIDVQLNNINGGSFAVSAAKKNSSFVPNSVIIDWMLEEEKKAQLNTIKPYIEFRDNAIKHAQSLYYLLKQLKDSGKKIFGYGASTKGNVLLQFCGIDNTIIDYIAEVNEDKFDCYTPGTNIPIISEDIAKSMNPDYFLVLPWHFRDNILKREREFIQKGGKFIFPLPFIEII